MGMTFAGKQCVDPRQLAGAMDYAGVNTERFLRKANRFVTRAGRKPGTGHVLLTGADFLSIDRTRDYSLTWQSDYRAGSSFTLPQLSVVSAECVLPAANDEPNRVFLVTLADRRVHLERVPCERAFNLSKADGSAYLTASLNSGVAWTWQQAVQRLWDDCGLTGTALLPFTPNGTPENLNYYAASAWAALCDLLDRIACVADYDPVKATFSVKRIGADTAEATVYAAVQREPRVWDSTWFETNRAFRPEKVRVTFTRFPLPTDGGNPYYTTDVTLTATAGVVAGTVVRLFDDMTALGASGTPTNSAALGTRATERANDWVRKFTTRDLRVETVYKDVFPEGGTPVGSALTAAEWRDLGDNHETVTYSESDYALENWRPTPYPGLSPVAGSLATTNADGTSAESPTSTVVADQVTGIEFINTTIGDGTNKLSVRLASGGQQGAVGLNSLTTRQTLGSGHKALLGHLLAGDRQTVAAATAIVNDMLRLTGTTTTTLFLPTQCNWDGVLSFQRGQPYPPGVPSYNEYGIVHQVRGFPLDSLATGGAVGNPTETHGYYLSTQPRGATESTRTGIRFVIGENGTDLGGLVTAPAGWVNNGAYSVAVGCGLTPTDPASAVSVSSGTFTTPRAAYCVRRGDTFYEGVTDDIPVQLYPNGRVTLQFMGGILIGRTGFVAPSA